MKTSIKRILRMSVLALIICISTTNLVFAKGSSHRTYTHRTSYTAHRVISSRHRTSYVSHKTYKISHISTRHYTHHKIK